MADRKVEAKVVILSVRGEHDLGYVALRMGAVGYLNKDLDLGVLPRVLRDVAEGGAAVSRSFTADLARQLRELPKGGIGMRPIQSVLTSREWEVVDQLCLGQSTEEIAQALVLTRRSPSVRTSRTSCANSTCTRARTWSIWSSGCAEVIWGRGRRSVAPEVYVPDLGKTLRRRMPLTSKGGHLLSAELNRVDRAGLRETATGGVSSADGRESGSPMVPEPDMTYA